MTAPQVPVAPAKTVRLLHAAFCIGVLLFALVVRFLILPRGGPAGALPPTVVNVLLTASLVICAGAFVVRQRVPRRSSSDSADRFWQSAMTPAMMTWAVADGAALLAIVTYMLTGASTALGVGALDWLAMIALNPWYLERP